MLHHTSGQSFGSGGGWLTLFGYRSPFLIFNAVLSLLDQCYFMCLFFFISGYFTPRSYDKKGPKAFLRDKIKRLGIPFLLYLLVIGPLMQCFIALVVAKDGGYEYKPDPGPSWFLAWLLLLNSCYCLIGGAPLVACPRPPLRNLILCYGIPLGLLQGVLQAASMSFGGVFLFMPITFGSLPFNILFFTAGIIAGRNGWLDEMCPAAEARAAMAVTVAIGVATIALSFSFYYRIPYDTPLQSNPNAPEPPMELLVIVMLVMHVCYGIATFAISFCVLDVFQRYGGNDKPGAIGRFLARAAYAVYLIHPWVLVLVTWSAGAAVSAEPVYERYGAGVTSRAYPDSGDRTKWLAFIYTAFLTQLAVWPLGGAVYRLPGVNRVL